jgi:iron complex transport system permease protein
MIDPFGRSITYLRVSVTDRCDLRCVYCMAEDMTFLPKADILSLEEIDRLCSAFIAKGVRKLRLTGGAVPAGLGPADAVLFSIRLPRVALAVLVGAALSTSGAAYQGLFRNPMVSPDILGVSSGAGVGASLAIIWGWPTPLLHAAAFAFGLGAVGLVLVVTRLVGRGGSLLVMILVGVVVSSLFSALGALIKYMTSNEQSLIALVLWLMGSLARAGSWPSLMILALVITAGAVPLFLLRWKLNALSFGEDEARAVGVNVERLKLAVVVCGTLMTASAVALCGLIGWVGLIIPHMARFLVGPNFRALLPVTMLGGGLFLLLVDSAVRLALPGEMPIGILTAIIGAPMFVYLLARGRQEWN